MDRYGWIVCLLKQQISNPCNANNYGFLVFFSGEKKSCKLTMYLSSSCKRTPSPPSIMGSYNHPGPSKPNLSLKKKRNMKEKFDSYLSRYTCKKKRLGMPNHHSQDASLSGKLMFTRIPRNVMSSWW